MSNDKEPLEGEILAADAATPFEEAQRPIREINVLIGDAGTLVLLAEMMMTGQAPESDGFWGTGRNDDMIFEDDGFGRGRDQVHLPHQDMLLPEDTGLWDNDHVSTGPNLDDLLRRLTLLLLQDPEADAIRAQIMDELFAMGSPFLDHPLVENVVIRNEPAPFFMRGLDILDVFPAPLSGWIGWPYNGPPNHPPKKLGFRENKPFWRRPTRRS